MTRVNSWMHGARNETLLWGNDLHIATNPEDALPPTREMSFLTATKSINCADSPGEFQLSEGRAENNALRSSADYFVASNSVYHSTAPRSSERSCRSGRRAPLVGSDAVLCQLESLRSKCYRLLI